jgi:hypothetical protein
MPGTNALAYSEKSFITLTKVEPEMAPEKKLEGEPEVAVEPKVESSVPPSPVLEEPPRELRREPSREMVALIETIEEVTFK